MKRYYVFTKDCIPVKAGTIDDLRQLGIKTVNLKRKTNYGYIVRDCPKCRKYKERRGAKVSVFIEGGGRLHEGYSAAARDYGTSPTKIMDAIRKNYRHRGIRWKKLPGRFYIQTNDQQLIVTSEYGTKGWFYLLNGKIYEV